MDEKIELTEREQELIDCIKSLMSMLNVMSVFITGVFKFINGDVEWANWYNDELKKLPFKLNDRQSEIVDILNSKFSQDIKTYVAEKDKNEDGNQNN